MVERLFKFLAELLLHQGLTFVINFFILSFKNVNDIRLKLVRFEIKLDPMVLRYSVNPRI